MYIFSQYSYKYNGVGYKCVVVRYQTLVTFTVLFALGYPFKSIKGVKTQKHAF